jgi:hypothetical protein
MEPALLIPIMALMIPIVAIVMSFKYKAKELELKAGRGGDPNVVSALEDMKRQIADLRDTTTRYDMSFDSALQRIESRVGNLENRVSTIERASTTAEHVTSR